MKRLMLAAGALLLATANTPPSTASSVAPGGELDSVVAAEAPKSAAPVAAKPAKPKPPRVAAAADSDGNAANGYPRCSGAVRDRCVQGRSGQARSSQGKVHHERRMQLAMRAGERG